MAKSKSYSPFKKGSSGVAPPDFDLANVNKKVAKPEDYNEIQFKAVDPMELRRQQKLKGTLHDIAIGLYSSTNYNHNP